MALFLDEVPTDSARGRAAEFALHVAELSRRGKLDVDLLRTRMKHLVTSEVAGWFTGLRGMSLKCLAISLALLDGLPYGIVANIAASLQRRLDPTPTASVDRFEDSRTHRIEQLRASIIAAEVPTRLGNLPAEIACYLDSAYPSAVLSRVWREHDSVREDLLAWLRDLGNHPVDAVRVRAATAIGLMSVTAFEHIHKAVLQPWARSSSDRKREMAAYALREPGTRTELRKQVLTLVDEWGRGNSWQRHAAAARVYGSSLGSAMPDHALRELDRLAVTDKAEVALAIGYSLAELIDADHTQAQTVVDRTLAWIGNGAGPRNPTGELAFLTIAADLIAPDSSGADWPLLLSLSVTDRRLRRSVATAWQQTLNGRLFHEDAQAIAGCWARLTEVDVRARDALALMYATAAAGSVRTNKIVRTMATTWMSSNGPVRAPHTAQAVLAALQ
jgi:hypothetical protein